jgi:hypothetical protein
MKPLRAADVRRAVGAALSAALDTRHKPIVSDMLNSAGSVSAEWYIETLWHYLAKKSLLQGVSSFDVEFRQPARLADKQLHFVLPHPEADDLVMDFHVMRTPPGQKKSEKVPVARIAIHRGTRRRRHGVAPDPPVHPYGIMDVARRGLQFEDERADQFDDHLLYIVPRFSFTPLADAAIRPNLFVYPEFAVETPWARGKTSAAARVTYWAVANDVPWPIAESVVTVVRTTMVDGVRRPVDETLRVPAKGAK